MYRNRGSPGIITDTVDDIARVYADALNTAYIFDVSKMRHWRQLYAWGKQVGMVVSLTGKADQYLLPIRDRYGTPMVAVRFSRWEVTFEYDAVYESWGIGWGVDKRRYASVASNRRPKPKPAFHMLSMDGGTATELGDMGYKVYVGNSYHLSDVALEPGAVIVPTAMYEAAASGMPVISTKENSRWTEILGAYDGLFLDDGIGGVVEEVCDSDFLYAGMMAVDMVPDLSDLRASIRSLLKHLRTD